MQIQSFCHLTAEISNWETITVVESTQ